MGETENRTVRRLTTDDDGLGGVGCHSSAARRVLVEQLTESVSINTVVVISCGGWCYGECLYFES